MATSLKNLSDNTIDPIENASHLKFGIVVSEWNSQVTDALADGAFQTLVKTVPGTFELTLGAQWLAEQTDVDAVICLGCVIQGETRHFDFICQGVTYGIIELNLKYNKPFIFGVLTTDTLQQALDRSGGKHGNKGDEAAVTALKMVALKQSL